VLREAAWAEEIKSPLQTGRILDPAEVEKLVRQLDAPLLFQREQAERQLRQLGPSLLGLLDGISTESLSSEARLRLQRIRGQLYQVAAKEVAKSSRVTLPAGITLGEAFRQLEEQTDNPVVVAPLPEDLGSLLEQVTLPEAMVSEPFWMALDRLMAFGGLTASFPPGKAVIRLLERKRGDERKGRLISYSGPFRLEILRMDRRPLPEGDQSEIVGHIRVAWEPRLRPIVLYWPSRDFQAEDEQGRILLPAPGEATREVPATGGSCAVELPVRWQCAGNPGRMIRALRGNMVVVFPGPTAQIIFSFGRAPAETHREGEVQVALERAWQEKGTTKLQLRVRYLQPFTSFESHRAWLGNYVPRLVLPNGRSVEPSASELVAQLPDQLAVVYAFTGITEGLANATLCWRLPAVLCREEFPWEFREVSLSGD
jgi:hypothetical protein